MSRILSLGALALALCAGAPAQTEPSVDELVAKNIAARGGIESIKAIQSLKITGKAVAVNGMEIPLTFYLKRPGLSRMEMEIQGKQMVQAFDGADSWSINPITGSGEPQKAPEEESKRAREYSDMMMDGFLVSYKAKGGTLELIGKDDVEGTPAYKLKLTTKDGTAIYVFLDAEKFLDVKSTMKIKQMGQELEVDSYPGNYRKVAGVMTPHSLDQRVGGRSVAKMEFAKVEPNVAMDDALFKMPAKPEPKAAEKKQ